MSERTLEYHHGKFEARTNAYGVSGAIILCDGELRNYMAYPCLFDGENAINEWIDEVEGSFKYC